MTASRAVVRRAYVRAIYTRRLVSTPDGGQISLDWWDGSLKKDLDPKTPVLLCLHAFAGKQQVLMHTTYQVSRKTGAVLHVSVCM